jgi:hypothetical protein
LYRVQQRFDATHVNDPTQELRRQLGDFKVAAPLRCGDTVAVAVGSRGISHLPALVKAFIAWLKELGLRPFVVPAMGSHGGATAQGQEGVLAHLGITEAAVGAPMRSSMAVVSLGSTAEGAQVFFSREALEADHLAVINRVKPHTAFRSQIESGLCKLLAVGLGKQEGAAAMHRHGLARSIVPAARRILEKAPVMCGVAVVENAFEQIHSLRLARPDQFESADRDLLAVAWHLFPRLPFRQLDALVVEEMGKNISGAGMDPNVVGFWRREGGEREPDFHVLAVLDLTPQSQGNATGIGMADLTTQRLLAKIDREATYANALTSGILRSARFPLALENDRQALEAVLRLQPDPQAVRLVRIKNTLELQRFWATAALLPELSRTAGLTADPQPLPLTFSAGGRLLPPAGETDHA